MLKRYNDGYFNWMENFFDSFGTGFYPTVRDSVFTVDVPGIQKEDLNVELNKGILYIKGKTGTRSVNYIYYVGERTKDPEITLKDGVLTIQFEEHKKEESKIRKLEIKNC